MSSDEFKSGRAHRWLRRLTVLVLVASLGTIVLVAGFSAWVVAVTVPVMVVDGNGRPLAGVPVFDWKAAASEETSDVGWCSGGPCGRGAIGGGFGFRSVAIQSEGDATGSTAGTTPPPATGPVGFG